MKKMQLSINCEAEDMEIKEITCKTALSKSNLPHLMYALNPYRGCEHACAYCYAPFILREGRPWGTFLEAKANMPAILEKELRKAQKGTVGIGTVTDPYQPAEARYGLTKKCLDALLARDFPICIQTKSALVVRDTGIIKKFSKKEVGITITMPCDDDRKRFEPKASSVQERLEALRKLNDSGIETWAFVGPILPGITDKATPKGGGLSELIGLIADTGTKSVMADRLRMKDGMREGLRPFIGQNYPELAAEYERALFVGGGYFEKTLSELKALCAARGLKFSTAF